MPKKRLTKLAEEYDVTFEEAFSIASKLPPEEISGKGKNTWISEEGQEILDKSLMIEEITPKYYKGLVKYEAPNPRFVYVHNKEIQKKIPVMIPKRLAGAMVGKMITFEAIEDNAGVSYRYVKQRLHNK